MMRVLVTGAAGFIGSYLIPKLLEDGAEVVAFDIAKLPQAFAKNRERIKYIRGDLGNISDLYRVMIENKVTHVVHLGSILAGPCEENPIQGFRINFQSTLALLDAAWGELITSGRF